MPQTSEVTPRVPLFKRLSEFLRELGRALDYDPVVSLEQRVHRLEKQISTQPTEHSNQRVGGDNG